MNRKISRLVGRNIRVARKYRDMTQADLGKKCHFDRSTISRIECGRKSPTLEHLECIASALDTDLITFLEDDLFRSETRSLNEIRSSISSLAMEYSFISDRMKTIEAFGQNEAELLTRILDYIHHIS